MKLTDLNLFIILISFGMWFYVGYKVGKKK